PANGGPAAGIPAPGSSAGSSTVAGIDARSLYAGISARGAGALWPDGGVFLYRGGRPREARLPKEKLGENVSAFSSGAIKTRTKRLHVSLRLSAGTRQRTRRH